MSLIESYPLKVQFHHLAFCVLNMPYDNYLFIFFYNYNFFYFRPMCVHFFHCNLQHIHDLSVSTGGMYMYDNLWYTLYDLLLCLR